MSQETGDREIAEQLTKEFRNLDGTLRELLKASANTNTTTQTIRFDVGSVGLWLSLTCCIVTVVLVAVGGIFYVDQMRRVDKMQDYLNVIYMQAPQLKPKDYSNAH